MKPRFPLSLLAACTAAGCAQGGDFPSLSPRPIEQLSFEEPIRTEAQVASSPAVIGRAAELLGQARSGDAAFEAAYAQALPVVRAAGAAQSESWLAAQEAITRAEAARVRTTSAVAELDRLLLEQADQPTSREDYAQLREAREAAERLMIEQQRQIDALRRSVG